MAVFKCMRLYLEGLRRKDVCRDPLWHRERRALAPGWRSGRAAAERRSAAPRVRPGTGPVIGAIAGDLVGSVYEGRRAACRDFPLFTPINRFTDDTVMTLAVAEAILDGVPYQDRLRELGRRHPDAGYGGTFRRWLEAEHPRPYHSFGNGSAMRVAAVPWFFTDEREVLRKARRSAEPTHDHPEGIKGAQAVALAVRMALDGASKAQIASRIAAEFGYDLSRPYEEVRADYGFDVTCQGSVPEAIVAFLASDGFEDALRRAVDLGGDADTQACIAGAIAEAFSGGVPLSIMREVAKRLTMDLLAILKLAVERAGGEPARAAFLPLVALREKLAASPDPLAMPLKMNRDAIALRARGAGRELDEAGWTAAISAAAGLEYGTYVLDFGGRGFGTADGRMAGLIADSIRDGRLAIANVPTTLAASMRARTGAAPRTYREVEHAIRYADMLAAQSVPR